MRTLIILLVMTGVAAGCGQSHDEASSPGEKPLFAATDGKPVFGDEYKPEGTSKGIILLFHQAHSNAGEYTTIAPRLVKHGWQCIAIDQRSGGDMFGRSNRTAAKYVSDPGYMAAYADLEGALSYARSKKPAKIVAWGSSYSASLVLKLAADHPELAAAICFSPGEYFDEKGIVAGWNARVKCPVFFASTTDESGDAKKLFDAGSHQGKRSADTFFAVAGGVHGSSTLIADKSKAADTYWAEVLKFLDTAAMYGAG